MFKIACAVLLLCSVSIAQEAQNAPTPPSTPATLAANSADGKTIDSLITALYEVISGPAGQKRDWERFRSLFVPGARLIPVSQRKEDGGGYEPHVLSPEDYVSRASGAFDKQGFFEKEVSRRTHRWGHIVELFSVYESRHAAAEAQPFARGINSIQLMYDGSRWWIVTIMWEAESPQVKLPPRLLQPQKGADEGR